MVVLTLPDDQNPTGARGVAFALNKRLVDTCNVTRFNLLPGRALAIQLNWTNGKQLTLLNVYAPNHMPENAVFWPAVRESLTRRRAPKVDIMLGDLNMVDCALDRLPPRKDPEDAATALGSLVTGLSLIDGWRRTHPGKRSFTYLQTSTGSQSRIDRIYVHRDLFEHAGDWDIAGAGIQTDHRMPTVAVANYNEPYIGKGRWALPHALLNDAIFLGLLRDEGMLLQTRMENRPARIWLAFKQKLRDIARKRAKERIPKLDRRIRGLRPHRDT
ncbi:hypothetical protein OH76DRAFT_1454029 [Lentinus brumalis]|uniref:DNase I-like protein n=1 Tax=Lentinus brumalis TaxID=2498619 RepID=A0A371DKS8_9APHY|nr:hypothetical protein OH76DRAFT_1454029 [Polyporus brumalis]